MVMAAQGADFVGCSWVVDDQKVWRAGERGCSERERAGERRGLGTRADDSELVYFVDSDMYINHWFYIRHKYQWLAVTIGGGRRFMVAWPNGQKRIVNRKRVIYSSLAVNTSTPPFPQHLSHSPKCRWYAPPRFF